MRDQRPDNEMGSGLFIFSNFKTISPSHQFVSVHAGRKSLAFEQLGTLAARSNLLVGIAHIAGCLM